MQSEDEVMQLIRIEARRHGILLWRNNSGVLKNIDGTPVRYGLCNESKKINKKFKSSDLIGLTQDGIFVAIEVKEEGWKYSGDEREVAQKHFIDYIKSKKGIAGFAASVQDFKNIIEEWEI